MTRGIPYRLVLVFAVAAGNAAAHRMSLLVLPDGDSVRGHAHYADGSPIVGVDVEVRNSAGEVLDAVTTDGEGQFAYTAKVKTDLVFVLETADGHRAETRFPRESLNPGESPAPVPAENSSAEAQMQHMIQHELAPLREQLDAYQREIRFRDIVGGLGYVVGVLGLVAWVKSRRPDRPR